MSPLADRLRDVRTRIEAACRKVGRAPGDVHLLAISKLHPLVAVHEAFALGQAAFGENYVQEAVEKVEADSSAGLEWHFVGRIQSNKAKLVANRFAYVHSIDRFEIAQRLDAATVNTQNIFVQLNVADESTKAGVGADELRALVERIAADCRKLRIVGLMVMPPLSEDPEATRPHFRAARELLTALRASVPSHPLDQLSMGTSADFEVAIAEGATWIRIGTEIFGPRPPRT